MRIDAHQHFWKYHAQQQQWIDHHMSAIKRDFLPEQLSLLLQAEQMDGCIAVQADETRAETDFLLDLARQYPFIKAVVGWVDMLSAEIASELDRYRNQDRLVGFRHVIEAEPDSDFLMQDLFLKSMRELTKRGYTYDLLIRPRHFQSTLACVQHNPQQQFILDHMAKPDIKNQDFSSWAVFIEAIAAFPNVACKVSGLLTEAHWQRWNIADFEPYIQYVMDCFGKDRIIFGTDWPVSTLSGTYADCQAIIEPCMVDFTAAEKAAFYGGNAMRIYQIKN